MIDLLKEYRSETSQLLTLRSNNGKPEGSWKLTVNLFDILVPC